MYKHSNFSYLKLLSLVTLLISLFAFLQVFTFNNNWFYALLTQWHLNYVHYLPILYWVGIGGIFLIISGLLHYKSISSGEL